MRKVARRLASQPSGSRVPPPSALFVYRPQPILDSSYRSNVKRMIGTRSTSEFSSGVWREPPLTGADLQQKLIPYTDVFPTALTMNDIISFDCPSRMVRFVMSEMPIRFVHRLRLMEALPNQWRKVEDIVKVHEALLSYLSHLLAQRPPQVEGDMQAFRVLVREINRLNSVPLLTTGAYELQQLTGDEFNSADADAFLNDFFLSRISTELLSLHFLALFENPMGYVNPLCDPVRVCTTARDVATDLCIHHYGYAYI